MSQDLSQDPLLASLPDARENGKKLGDVILKDLLGRGGMGAVYRGTHGLMNVDVAVKVLLHQKGEVADAMVKRFLREARLAVQIDHPNVTRVMNVATVGPLHYLVMEFIDGVTAKALVAQNGPLPEPEAARIIHDACLGLGAAFEQCGLIHRDMKPDNVMVRRRDGRVKVTDLGLAKETGAQDQDAPLTLSQATMGTPQYMPPEQVEGAGSVDHRADIYSLGATYYSLLTGQVPFSGDTAYTILHKVVTETPRDPRGLRPDLSDAALAILTRCMAKKPDDRFATHADLCSALRPLCEATLSVSTELREAAAMPRSPEKGDKKHWYYAVGRERVGPVSRETLHTLVEEGKISPESMVWKKGLDKWIKASRIKGLFEGRTPTKVEAGLDTPPPLPDRTPPPVPVAALVPDDEPDPPVAALVPDDEKDPVASIDADPRPKIWHAAIDNVEQGPFSLAEMQSMAAAGKLKPEDEVWKDGMAAWAPARTVPEIRTAGSSSAIASSVRTGGNAPRPSRRPPRPGPRPASARRRTVDKKDPTLAAVLSCLICGLGQIYNNEVGKGIGMFAACVVLWVVALGWIINIWSIVDAYNVAKATQR